jgi:hypothetical protein
MGRPLLALGIFLASLPAWADDLTGQASIIDGDTSFVTATPSTVTSSSAAFGR